MEKLLIKYITGNITAEDRRRVVEWVKQDKAHLEQYEALRKIYTIVLWQDKDIAPSTRIKPKVKFYLREIMKVAAIFIIALCSILTKDFFFPSSSKENATLAKAVLQKIHVPAGQRVNLTLIDGTKVWLNANTTFTFPNLFTDTTRQIELDGEAYFEVTSNQEKPFIVKTAKHDVKVLGTNFNVMAYSTDSIFETGLMSGKVEIHIHGGETLALTPNHKVTSRNGSMNISEIRNLDHYRWTEGLLCFDNEPIENLINQMQSYFNVKIILNNEKIGKRRYSGKFYIDDGIEHMLKVLQINNQFTYQRNLDTNEYIIN